MLTNVKFTIEVSILRCGPVWWSKIMRNRPRRFFAIATLIALTALTCGCVCRNAGPEIMQVRHGSDEWEEADCPCRPGESVDNRTERRNCCCNLSVELVLRAPTLSPTEDRPLTYVSVSPTVIGGVLLQSHYSAPVDRPLHLSATCGHSARLIRGPPLFASHLIA